MDLGFFGPVFNKHTNMQKFLKKEQNQQTICGKNFESLEILQRTSLLNTGLEHSRSYLVFK